MGQTSFSNLSVTRFLIALPAAQRNVTGLPARKAMNPKREKTQDRGRTGPGHAIDLGSLSDVSPNVIGNVAMSTWSHPHASSPPGRPLLSPLLSPLLNRMHIHTRPRRVRVTASHYLPRHFFERKTHENGRLAPIHFDSPPYSCLFPPIIR